MELDNITYLGHHIVTAREISYRNIISILCKSRHAIITSPNFQFPLSPPITSYLLLPTPLCPLHHTLTPHSLQNTLTPHPFHSTHPHHPLHLTPYTTPITPHTIHPTPYTSPLTHHPYTPPLIPHPIYPTPYTSPLALHPFCLTPSTPPLPLHPFHSTSCTPDLLTMAPTRTIINLEKLHQLIQCTLFSILRKPPWPNALLIVMNYPFAYIHYLHVYAFV